MTEQTQTTTQSWLWPDRTIGKRESRELREEHNRAVNALAAVSEALVFAETKRGEMIDQRDALLAAAKGAEARLTAAARAFYVDGKPAKLREALHGWQDDIDPLRAAIDAAT